MDFQIRNLSITSSFILFIFYVVRYRHISRRLSINKDLNRFTIVTLILIIWNLIINELDTKYFESYKFDDTRLLSTSIISLLLYLYFSKASLYLVEFASYMQDNKLSLKDLEIGSNSVIIQNNNITNTQNNNNNKNNNRNDINTNKHKTHRKNVSFNEKTIQYIYSEDNLQVSSSSIKDKFEYRSLFKKSLKFALMSFGVFIGSLFLIPHSVLLISSYTVYFDDYFIIKTDHFVHVACVMFLANSMYKFYKTLNHPSIKCFSKGTAIATTFTWVYSCCILCLSIYCLGLFKDVYINIEKNLRTNNSSNSDVLNNSFYSMTLLLSKTFQRSFPVCNEANNINLCVIQNVQLITSSCLTILNLFCFIIVPFLLWIIQVELKSFGIKN